MSNSHRELPDGVEDLPLHPPPIRPALRTPGEFYCDDCGARCTRSPTSSVEYGHHPKCPNRAAAGFDGPPEAAGLVTAKPAEGWDCPTCDYSCYQLPHIQSHHVQAHGNRATKTECDDCGVTVLVGRSVRSVVCPDCHDDAD